VACLVIGAKWFVIRLTVELFPLIYSPIGLSLGVLTIGAWSEGELLSDHVEFIDKNSTEGSTTGCVCRVTLQT